MKDKRLMVKKKFVGKKREMFAPTDIKKAKKLC